MSAIDKTNPGLFAAGTDLKYEALMWDEQRQRPVPGDYINSMTLSLVDTLTKNIINNVDQINILNKDRGSIDQNGNLVITLNTLDTTVDANIASIQRSLVVDWSYNSGQTLGRHQFNFRLVNLIAP